MTLSKKSYSLEKLELQWTPKPDRYISKSDKDNNETKETVVDKSEPMTFRPFFGVFFACFHSIFNQVTSVIIKKLPYIDPCQLSLIRNVGVFVGILPISIYHTNQILGKRQDRIPLILRSFLGTTGLYFQFIAYSYLPLAEASIVMSTLPPVTAIVARILLKERYGLAQCISLFLTISGVLLALRLPKLVGNRNSVRFDTMYVAGLLAAMGNVLFFSLSAIYIRKMNDIHFSVVSLYSSVIGMIENSVLAGIFIPLVPPECGLDQILCILLGATAFVANSFFILAIQAQPAGIAVVQKSSFDILIITVFQIIFFNVYPDWYVIAGACLVILSLLLVGVKIWIATIPETSKIRRNLKWLLL